MQKILQGINIARKQFKPRVNICWNEDGSLISNEQEILDEWVRYFDKLRNGGKGNDLLLLLPQIVIK